MTIFHSFVALLPFLGLRAVQGCFHIGQEHGVTWSFISSNVIENGVTCSLHCTISGISKHDLDVSVDYAQRHVVITGILIDPTEEKIEYLQQTWIVDSSVNLLELTMGILDGNLTVSIPKQLSGKHVKGTKTQIRGAPRSSAIEMRQQHSTDADGARISYESPPIPPLPNAIAAARFTKIGAVEEDF